MEKPLQICEYNYIDDTTIEFVVPYDVFIYADKIIIKDDDSEESRTFEEVIDD